MTIDQMKLARLGLSYWQEYVRINGYAFAPSDDGIRRLGRLLDLNSKHLRKCINAYLAA